MYCAICCEVFEAKRSDARFCSPRCRQSAYRARSAPAWSHQRRIREAAMLAEPRAALPSLAGCKVERVPLDEARPVIVKYEWLGTIGSAAAAYGLRADDGELLGVALFGRNAGNRAGHVCGVENAALAITLERGACVHYAPKNAASFLIAGACKLAALDHGWRIFMAYADPRAGELGTVYQACNWIFIGSDGGRNGRPRTTVVDPRGNEFSPRGIRHKGIKVTDIRAWPGWKLERRPSKHKYVAFYGGDARERAALRAALTVEPLPYPRR